MAQLILTRSSQFHRAIRTSNTYPLTLRVGKFFLLFGMTLMIGLLSFFYLIKFTEIHTKGYQLRRLELERDKLVSAREIKSTSISKEKTLASIKQSSITMNMVPLRNAIYIKQDGSVAQLPVENGNL